jgi:hypothetical protein
MAVIVIGESDVAELVCASVVELRLASDAVRIAALAGLMDMLMLSPFLYW